MLLGLVGPKVLERDSLIINFNTLKTHLHIHIIHLPKNWI